MSGTAIITELITIITSGLVSMGQGIGQGIMAMIKALFFETAEGTTTLSVFAVLIAVFAAISLAFSLTRLILLGLFPLKSGQQNTVICWNPLRAFNTLCNAQ